MQIPEFSILAIMIINIYYKLVSCSPHFSISVVLAPLFQLDRKGGVIALFELGSFPRNIQKICWDGKYLYGWIHLIDTWISWIFHVVVWRFTSENSNSWVILDHDFLAKSRPEWRWRCLRSLEGSSCELFVTRGTLLKYPSQSPNLLDFFLSFWGFDRSKVRKASGFRSFRPKAKPPTSKMIRHPTSFQACLESE
jgi:hypothetical protein